MEVLEVVDLNKQQQHDLLLNNKVKIKYINIFPNSENSNYNTCIIFFETEGNAVMAHTKNDMYETRRKLYELEELSGGRFQRISKSAIVNVDKVYSIKRNVTSSSAIEFQGTHKQIYVSRAYYKVLREKLEEKR